MQKLYIVKIGGNVIDDEVQLEKFLKDFSHLKENKILVHGGGKVATEISRGLGIEAQMVEGRRITDAETLKIVTMVYGGLINKKIVSKLQSYECNAIGLTGADANLLLAEKRPVKNGMDYGFVGDVKKVHPGPLIHFLSMGLTPVIAPLTHNGEGSMLNTNADTVASSLAVGLSANFSVELIYCFELNGVLENFEDKNSVIPSMNEEKYQELKQAGIISKGMVPKMDNSFDAIREGVSAVVICHADDLTDIVTHKNIKGTTLKSDG
jgi:acetylglutamate kinase